MGARPLPTPVSPPHKRLNAVPLSLLLAATGGGGVVCSVFVDQTLRPIKRSALTMNWPALPNAPPPVWAWAGLTTARKVSAIAAGIVVRSMIGTLSDWGLYGVLRRGPPRASRGPSR